MNKWKLGIDIDGTITDPSTFIPFLNEAFQKNLTYEDITQYELPPLYGVSTEDFTTWFIQNEGRIYSISPLAKGVKQVLHELHLQEHELIYISARHNRYHALTLEWFKHHSLPYHHIELVGKHDKIAVAQQFEINLFLEDKMDNANELAEVLDIPVLLFDTPYNKGSLHPNVMRVQHWEEARGVLRDLLQSL